MITIIWILFALFTILQVGDVITTVRALTQANANEANPILRAFMAAVGLIPALILTKIMLLAIVAGAVWFYPSTWLWIGLTVINVAYVSAVWNNYTLTRES